MITARVIQGHWVRDWLKAPGVEDLTTRVHWMQAGPDYADVRIPLDRPGLGAATCLAQLPVSALASLARAEGFAGHVTLEKNQCTWHREINWHGAPETLDVGAIHFDAEGRMVEEGVLADYTELWSQKARSATTSLRFGNETHAGIFVRSSDVAVLGIGRPAKPATIAALRALEVGVIPDTVADVFDGLHALCRVSGQQLVATHATDPFVEGNPVLTIRDGVVSWHRIGFDGARANIEMRVVSASG